jgi:hypothetical protein
MCVCVCVNYIIRMYVCVCVYTYIHTCMHACMCVCVCQFHHSKERAQVRAVYLNKFLFIFRIRVSLFLIVVTRLLPRIPGKFKFLCFPQAHTKPSRNRNRNAGFVPHVQSTDANFADLCSKRVVLSVPAWGSLRAYVK